MQENVILMTVAAQVTGNRDAREPLFTTTAGAVAFGYSNIFVTSPSPENLNTLFEFVLKGLNTMGYEEHLNYQVLRSADQQFNKCVLKIVVTRDRQQVIQYIPASESSCLGQAELVVTLEESIRYKSGDPVETWLHQLLCLEASFTPVPSLVSPPDKCQLFYVNRDTLFGYHKVRSQYT
ncbi:RNA cytidine acetyltransferase [Portunus trituberculatus]|uniref:RNA cytidine acetyltransferase n=1 Tax=Portunus trituberculatus TaxID=210409 RepID=A0A5B7G0M1_PORTR|nr:RNA cytidine acetyltransferase [Portunus trituberculatus]